jgi:ribosomal protein S18 acetylase RimI-like enzyme
MNLQLKKCDLESLNDLVWISLATFAAAFEKDNNPVDFKTYVDFSFAPAQLRSELLNSDTDFYFVYRDATLVGYFKLNRNNSQTDIKLPEAIELERIYVLADYIGKGIGQWMLDRIKIIASDLKKEFIWLGVWEKNGKAIAFYEKNGFTKFGMHPYYIGSDKQIDWLMRFDLTTFNA